MLVCGRNFRNVPNGNFCCLSITSSNSWFIVAGSEMSRNSVFYCSYNLSRVQSVGLRS